MDFNLIIAICVAAAVMALLVAYISSQTNHKLIHKLGVELSAAKDRIYTLEVEAGLREDKRPKFPGI